MTSTRAAALLPGNGKESDKRDRQYALIPVGLLARALRGAPQAAGLAGPLMFKRALDSLTKVEGPLTRAAALSAVSALVLSAASKVSDRPSD